MLIMLLKCEQFEITKKQGHTLVTWVLSLLAFGDVVGFISDVVGISGVVGFISDVVGFISDMVGFIIYLFIAFGLDMSASPHLS